MIAARGQVPEALHAWLAGTDPAKAFEAAAPAGALGRPVKIIQNLLRAWTPTLITVEPGTGTRHGPFRYRRAEPFPGLDEALAILDQERKRTPPKVRAAWPEPLSGHAHLLGLLREDPARQWTSADLARRAGLEEAKAVRLLEKLIRSGSAQSCPGEGGCRYKLAPLDPHQPAAAVTEQVEVPAGLGFDERVVFETLRREPRGLPRRVLGARLNWSDSRTDRAASSLELFRHVQEVEGRLQVKARTA